MSQFKTIPAKISAQELESHEADRVQREANATRSSLPSNYFLSQNAEMVRTIQSETQRNLKEEQEHKDEAARKAKQNRGALPPYLRRFKQEAENDYYQT